MGTDRETIEKLAAVLAPKGPLGVVALRPVLYLEHEIVQAAVKILERRVVEHESGILPLNELERLAAMLIMEAAGLK